MSAAGLTDRHGVEIRALEEHVLRVLRHAAFQATEHTGDAHRFVAIGDHQVALVHFTLNAVQCYEFLTRLGITHMDLITFDLVSIKRVQRLSALVQYEVRHIDHVIDRTKADCQQAVLQPFRRL